VPEKVRVQFETARNLMLYTWFVFEFQTIAELQAYASLELALRERLGNPTRKVRNGKVLPLMLADLLDKAVGAGLFVPEQLRSWDWHKLRREWFSKTHGFASQPLSASDWLEYLKSSLPDARNYLAHGNLKLWLPHSFTQLELCADLINALFPSPTSPAPRA
jgi:hypothetical protein